MVKLRKCVRSQLLDLPEVGDSGQCSDTEGSDLSVIAEEDEDDFSSDTEKGMRRLMVHTPSLDITHPFAPEQKQL